MRNLEWNMNDVLQARFDEGRNEERENVAVKMLRKGKSFNEVHASNNSLLIILPNKIFFWR